MSEVKVERRHRDAAYRAVTGARMVFADWSANGDMPGYVNVDWHAIMRASEELASFEAAGRAEGVAGERKRVCEYGSEVLPKPARWFIGDIESGEHDKVAVESGENVGGGES